MSDEVRKRAACDRCHAQKIRCPRRPGQEICDRCVKAKAACIYSPFRQKKVPEEGSGSDEQSIESRDVVLKVDDIEETSHGITRVKRKRGTPGVQVQDSDINTMLGNSSLDFGIDWMSQPFSLPEQPLSLSGVDGLEFETHDPSFMSFDFGGALPSVDSSSPSASNNKSDDSCSQFNLMVEERRNANLRRSLTATAGLLMDGDDSSSPSTSVNSGSSDFIWRYPSRPVDSGSTSHCVQQLSKLSVDLFEHLQTIPAQSMHDPHAPENQGVWATMPNYENFVIEDTFRLTQAMIEVYPSFLSAFTSQKTKTSVAGFNKHIDQSAILLILSCHLRLINIYEELFKRMDVCVMQNGKAATPQEKMLQGPQLKIGSYVPPDSSVIPMQMLLLMQFASQLFHYASDLAAEIAGPALTPSSLSSSSTASSNDSVHASTLALTRAAAENVKDRARSMSRQINDLRVSMIASGIPA